MTCPANDINGYRQNGGGHEHVNTALAGGQAFSLYRPTK
jgi:hypothetical protein